MAERPILVDVYAGVGGLSLGAARAGFDVKLAVELDRVAAETHHQNFPEAQHLQADVGTLTASALRRAAGVPAGGISGLVGGPPCQGFSTIGKRDPADTRNHLFVEFFRLARDLKPTFFIAENVPGILSDRYKHILDAAFQLVERDYNVLKPITVVASDFGAPTTRKRVFFIGYRPNAMRHELMPEDFQPGHDVAPVYVDTALSGLPRRIFPDWQDYASGCRKVGDLPQDHFFQRVIDMVPEGVGCSETLRMYQDESLVTGCLGTAHEKHIIARFDKLKPGEQDSISKAVRLHPTKFCPTLRAGTGRDKGSFQSLRPVHHTCPRVITPREAARLQGFPDWFAFHPTKWHSFRQIGNSVSPIVAEAILARISRALR